MHEVIKQYYFYYHDTFIQLVYKNSGLMFDGEAFKVKRWTDITKLIKGL